MKKLIRFGTILLFVLIFYTVSTSAASLCDFMSPVAHWNLTVNGNDCSGNAPHTGTVNRTMTSFGDGVSFSNQGVALAGTNDFLANHNVTFGEFGNNPFTVCMNYSSTTTNGNVIGTIQSDNTGGWFIQHTNTAFRNRKDTVNIDFNPNPENTFREICVVHNTTHMTYYNNGVFNQSTAHSASSDEGTTPFTMGVWSGDLSSDDFTGTIRDATLYESELSATNISDRFNKQFGAAAATATLDIIFTNTTGSAKTVFDEGERIVTELNWSSEGVDLNDTVGNCSIRYANVSRVVDAQNETFTLCNTGCDFDQVIETFDAENNLTFLGDTVDISVCHVSNPIRDLSVTFNCGGDTDTQTIPAAGFDLCSTGFTEVMVNTSACAAHNEVNITLDNNAGAINNGHNISTWEFQRQWEEHTIASFGDDVDIIFNASTQLWRATHNHLFILAGTYPVNATCSHVSDSNLNINVTEQLTLLATPPVVDIIGIDFNEGTTVNFNKTNDNVEYINGTWSFKSSVSGFDVVNITYTLRNSSTIFLQLSVSTPQDFNVSSTFFVDTDQKNFNFTITANNIELNFTTETVLFNVSDTSDPVCTGFSNTTNVNATFYNWTAANNECHDEHLFSFNITCDNNFNFFRDNINAQNFSFINGTNITSETTCAFEVCDGHTAKNIYMETTTDKNSGTMTFDGVEVRTIEAMDSLRLNYKGDSYGMCFTPKTKSNTLTIMLPDSFVYSPLSSYSGHFIDYENRMWFDVEPFDTSDVTIIGNQLQLDISSYQAGEEICLNSIGKLNCITFSQLIELAPQDQVVPNVTVVSPLNFTNLTSSPVAFSLSVTELTNCTMNFGGVLNQTNNSVNQSFSFSSLELATGFYNWSVNCTDAAQNSGLTGLLFFNITIPTGGVDANHTLQYFECDLSSTGEAIGIVGFLAIIVGVTLLGLIKKIPMLTMFSAIFLAYYSWNIAACFQFAQIWGILVAFISIILSFYQIKNA